MMMLPRRHQQHQRFSKGAIILLICSLSTTLTLTHARKALGGSGGLLTRGSSAPSAGFGETAANDPLKLVDIGETTKQGWSIPPINTEELIEKLGKEHRDVAQYIGNTLGNSPLSVKLNKRKVGMKQQQAQQQNFASPTATLSNQDKYRAQVIPASDHKKVKKSKLRSVWYVATDRAVSQTSAARQKTEDLLTKSYDDNISNFNPSHFVLEVFLPKTRACKGGNPVITYTIPMGAGTTSPKSRVSQSNGKITVFPNGRKKKGGESNEAIEIGSTSLHMKSGPPLVDPTWARGRKYFWKGRSVGQV